MKNIDELLKQGKELITENEELTALDLQTIHSIDSDDVMLIANAYAVGFAMGSRTHTA